MERTMTQIEAECIANVCSASIKEIVLQQNNTIQTFRYDLNKESVSVASRVFICNNGILPHLVYNDFDVVIDFTSTLNHPKKHVFFIIENSKSSTCSLFKKVDFSPFRMKTMLEAVKSILSPHTKKRSVFIYAKEDLFIEHEIKKIPHTNYIIQINKKQELDCIVFQHNVAIAHLKTTFNQCQDFYREHALMSKLSFMDFNSFVTPAEYFTKKDKSLICSMTYGKKDCKRFDELKFAYFNEILKKTATKEMFMESVFYNELLDYMSNADELERKTLKKACKKIEWGQEIIFTFSHGNFTSEQCTCTDDKIGVYSLEFASFYRPAHYDFFFEHTYKWNDVSDYVTFYIDLEAALKLYFELFLLGLISSFPEKRELAVHVLETITELQTHKIPA